MIDIGVEEQLRAYLRPKGLFKDFDRVSLIYYPGGVSGIVALLSDGEKDVIVKQALPKLKVKADWRCDPGRIITEHRANEIYARLVPDCVPATIFADEENKVIARVGAPEGITMWKAQLLEGLVDFRVARKVINALAIIHNASSKDGEIRRDFDDNSIFYDLRIEPYIETVAKVYPDLYDRSLPIVKRLMEEKVALVHGDFSPKNILVQGETIFILDYEVAHFGHPSFDLAFFFNLFMLKAVKNKQWSDAYLSMVTFMASQYFAQQTVMDSAILEEETSELVAFMLLARVDGKSPAEYITEETDKDLIRRAARTVLRRNVRRLDDVAALVHDGVRLYA